MKSNSVLQNVILLIFIIITIALPINFANGEILDFKNNDNSKPAEFIKWYNSGDNKTSYLEYEKFLKSQNAYGIFPTWQLLISDTQYIKPLCPLNKFVLPPKKYWPNSVRTIKFIEKNIIPKIGKVKIVSGFRPTDFNKCIGGASKSKHLEFGAFDLVSVEHDANDRLFNNLCEIWQKTNSRYGFGLGAYWDKFKKIGNPSGRFHIDTFGKRTWGLNYKSETSFCISSK